MSGWKKAKNRTKNCPIPTFAYQFFKRKNKAVQCNLQLHPTGQLFSVSFKPTGPWHLTHAWRSHSMRTLNVHDK